MKLSEELKIKYVYLSFPKGNHKKKTYTLHIVILGRGYK